MFEWKYGLVLVRQDGGRDTCQIYELYKDIQGQWTSFSSPRIDSVEDVEKLHRDIKKDGINKWFYNNGEFLYNSQKNEWEWERKVE